MAAPRAAWGIATLAAALALVALAPRPPVDNSVGALLETDGEDAKVDGADDGDDQKQDIHGPILAIGGLSRRLA